MELTTCHYQYCENGLGMITLNRPQQMNAINERMTEEVGYVLDQAAADDEVRVLILTGAGSAFCAGGDVSWLMQADDEEKKRNIVDRAGKLISKLWSLPKPILAAVNGIAAGAGTALVLACDLNIAADTARFAPNFVNIAAVPDSGASWFLSRAVGMHKAMQLMLSGEVLTAQKAYALGIFGAIVPAEELEKKALESARSLAQGPQGAIRSIKTLIKSSLDNDLSTQMEEEAVRQVQAWSDPDFEEGVAAFQGKRFPRFA